jgi:hypothetical protein
MQSEIIKQLYIKHAVGSRMLFDVSGNHKAFELSEVPEGWRFTIADVEQETAQLLQDNARDLNIFYFVHQPGQPVQKSWFFDKDHPHITYDETSRQCRIQIDSKLDYNNENV